MGSLKVRRTVDGGAYSADRSLGGRFGVAEALWERPLSFSTESADATEYQYVTPDFSPVSRKYPTSGRFGSLVTCHSLSGELTARPALSCVVSEVGALVPPVTKGTSSPLPELFVLESALWMMRARCPRSWRISAHRGR